MILYNELILSIKTFLKERDFIKQGESFIKKKANNLGIINFQKSRDSSKNEILFTINIGVYLNALSIFDHIDMLNKPSIDGCHWKSRVYPILSDTKESWWHLSENMLFGDIDNKVKRRLEESGLPEIEKFIVYKNLKDAWLAGFHGGLSEQQRQIYLIALLKNENKDNWQDLVQQLIIYSQGKSFQYNIKENLMKLGIKI